MPWRHMGEWRYSSTILDLGTRRTGCFTPGENAPRYPLDRRLGGPQSRSGRCGEQKYLVPAGNRSPTVQPVTVPTDLSRLITKMYYFFIRIVGGGTGSTQHVGHWMAYCTCPGWLWWWRIWWNEDWQGKLKYSEKNLSQRYFVHHKSHLTDPGSNPGRRVGKPATNRLSYSAAYHQNVSIYLNENSGISESDNNDKFLFQFKFLIFFNFRSRSVW
jgi:hypothetical protein